MPELAPFRGLLFDPAKVTLAKVLAPPAAVMDGPTRARMLQAEPHNVARLITAEADADRDAAVKELAAWRASATLVRDPGRAIYRVVDTAPVSTPGARPLVRRGVLAAVRLEAVGDNRISLAERVIPARV